MTSRQRDDLYGFFDSHFVSEFHHGDCEGADQQAHEIAESLYIPIFIHPPTNPVARAFCSGAFVILKPKPYLERNHDIVDAVDFMLAAPKGPEVLRSGTWATIRYAKQINKPLLIL